MNRFGTKVVPCYFLHFFIKLTSKWYQKGGKMMAEKYEDRTAFTLRLENKLYEKIKKSAEKNKRSIAKEIEFALEKYVEQ
jgi:hypothetical protein